MTIADCHLVEFPKISDSRGNLTFIEGETHILFPIKRVFYVYEVSSAADRGAHAHKTLHQVMIAITGNFDVIVDDGCEKKRVRLDRANCGLHVTPMVWSTLENFSTGAVCLVLASEQYDESDYYRDYGDFLMARGLR